MRPCSRSRAVPLIMAALVLFVSARFSAYAQSAFDKSLAITGWIDEDATGSPGMLRWTINLTIRNDSKEEVFFGDDMALMEGQPETSYDGVYVIYHAAAPVKSPGSWSFYGKATAFGLASFERNWPDGTSRSFRNGGQYSFADPPEYKPKKTFCNASLKPGQSVTYQATLRQGTWTKPEFRKALLLVMPEVKNASGSARWRPLVSFARAGASAPRWDIARVSTVAMEKKALEALLSKSQANIAMKIIAFNLLAAVDPNAAMPILQSEVQRKSESLALVSAIQLLGLIGLQPDADTLGAVNYLASEANTGGWSRSAATRFLKKQTGE